MSQFHFAVKPKDNSPSHVITITGAPNVETAKRHIDTAAFDIVGDGDADFAKVKASTKAVVKQPTPPTPEVVPQVVAQK
jgi:hypothetical protein